MNRVCNVCKESKPLTDYYQASHCKDGYVSTCKACKYAKDEMYRAMRRCTPEGLEQQRERDRLAVARRGGSKWKRSYDENKTHNKQYVEKYPEKQRAISLSQNVRMNGMEKHHWNYNEGFEKDVIFYSHKDHMTIHRFMVYDQERFMYRTLDGELLDSRESAQLYYDSVIEREKLRF